MQILNKNKKKEFENLPIEIQKEVKKLPKNRRKRAIELYKLYEEGKVLDLKKMISEGSSKGK